MNKDNNIILVLPFSSMQYSLESLTYMLPGIIHKYFGNYTLEFDAVIINSLGSYIEDKGEFNLMRSYYVHMSDAIGMFLEQSGHAEAIKQLLSTHYVEEVEITSQCTDLFIKWKPVGNRECT